MNSGQTVFAQLMQFVPWTSFSRIVARHEGDLRARRLNCAEHFRILAFAQLSWRESLRDIELSLGANEHKLYAMGLRHKVHRSTLADANETRNWRIWQEVALLLLSRARKCSHRFAHNASESITSSPSSSRHNADCEQDPSPEDVASVYALDSTTVDLCLSLFNWARFDRLRASVKLHTLLDLRSAVPAFVHVSPGTLNDIKALSLLHFEPGAFYVMDRGYVDFSALHSIHLAQAFFVIRAKSNLLFQRRYSAQIAHSDKHLGVKCDQTITMVGALTATKYPSALRRIRFKDPLTQKTFVYLTNNTTLPGLSICQLYKQRWQIELFFKWIKQHLRIRQFLGRSENAVKTQIWCAMATYALVATAKYQLRLDASLYAILQILSVSLFEKTQLSWAFAGIGPTTECPDHANQLNLFPF